MLETGYVIMMAVGILGLVMLSRLWSDVPMKYWIIHIGVLGWSGWVYANWVVPGNSYGYYIDWVVSTPLMLLGLGLTLGGTKIGLRRDLFVLISAQVLMITSGWLAATQDIIFFIPGMVALVVVLFVVWRLYLDDTPEIFSLLPVVITTFWILYPVIWIIGEPGLGIITQDITRILFVIVPLLSKGGFAYLDVWLLHQHHDREKYLSPLD